MHADVIEARPAERPAWRVVAMPSEHGGWGLTMEPVLLGLLVAWSLGGLALGVAAFAAFLVRTPLKLCAADIRHDRWLPRTGTALRFAIIELLVMVAAASVVVWRAGFTWLIPIATAVPLVAVELTFDLRSRGRRLVPELCGAVGISAVAASIVVADSGSGRLAAGLWLILIARAVGAIPFVRAQIVRLRRGPGHGSVRTSDVAQVISLVVAAAAVVAHHRLVAGAAGVVLLACWQLWSVRRDPIPAKRLGMRQMVAGLGLVAVSAVGVLR